MHKRRLIDLHWCRCRLPSGQQRLGICYKEANTLYTGNVDCLVRMSGWSQSIIERNRVEEHPIKFKGRTASNR